MRISKLGLGSMAEAAHLVASAVQAARRDPAVEPGAPAATARALPDLSLVKVQINLRAGRARSPVSPVKEEA